MLVALILTFGPISGAHFNPAVTLADAWQGGMRVARRAGLLAAQLAGAFAGVCVRTPHVRRAGISLSRHVRAGGAQIFSEFIATFGLLSVIWGCARRRSSAVPFAVGAYIAGGILVYRLHVLRQSGSDTSARRQRHLRRNPSHRCAGLHRGATGRCGGGHASCSAG